MLAIGIDIGGTKCVACLGKIDENNAEVLSRCPERPTKEYTPKVMLDALIHDVKELLSSVSGEKILGIGISCGGPLNSNKGIILSPPNLPGWNEIHITDIINKHTNLPVWLCNDANAGALAEWRFGAGRGYSNMIFLTCGTGMGAGLILDNHLYIGACDMAGEIGHMRLSDYGPVGYCKMGSFEGFCSGGGIAQLAKSYLLEQLQAGKIPPLCKNKAIEDITAKDVGEFAANGDPLACQIMRTVGEKLGRGLAVLIDLLNPDIIVIGGVFVRCRDSIWPITEKIIEQETLCVSREVCRVMPSELSESVGDIAALAVAWYYSGV